MLPEPVLAMGVIAALVVMAGCLAMMGTLALRQMRRLEAGIESILEATHENGRDINGFSQNVGKIARYSEASVQFQRKVHDHQRVLLTSLNKQMRHLETMLEPPRAEPSVEKASPAKAPPSANPRPAMPLRPSGSAVRSIESETGAGTDKPQPVPFHELFAAANRSAANIGAAQPRKVEGSQKAVMLARLFKDGKFSGVTTADGLDRVMSDASQDKTIPQVASPAANAGIANGMIAEDRFTEELRKVGNG
jgi:hypothetical protein